MKIKISFGYFCCLLVFLSAARGQSGGKISLQQSDVTAGDSLTVSATVDKPFPCDAQMEVVFVSADRSSVFEAIGIARQGQTVFTASVKIPRDIAGGTYQSANVNLWPCPGYSKNKSLSLENATVRVKALADSLQYPARAEVALLPTQKQFLDTKIFQLNNLDNQLTTAIEKHSDDGPQVRAELIRTVESAAGALSKTEDEYKKEVMKPNTSTPAFFAEFRIRYAKLLDDLRAPIPGRAQADLPFGVALRYVQLKQRSLSGNSEASQDMSGVYPPSVVAVRAVIRDNSAAYKYVRDTGRITFDVRFTSYPKGARILYRKMIDSSFSEYSSPTDVQDATFDLATWIFKFQKYGCTDDQVVQVDPYEDSHPNVSVEFSHCKDGK